MTYYDTVINIILDELQHCRGFKNARFVETSRKYGEGDVFVFQSGNNKVSILVDDAYRLGGSRKVDINPFEEINKQALVHRRKIMKQMLRVREDDKV